MKKFLERNETLIAGIVLFFGSLFWTINTHWKEFEPIVGLISSCTTILVIVFIRSTYNFDNKSKVILEHYCSKPAFSLIGKDTCRILVGNFINDKTEQVALELSAKYTQVKHTELPNLHIRYCQNYDIYFSNALKIKDENYCDLLFYGDIKEKAIGKNYLRLNFVIQKRISDYSIDQKGFSEEYQEFSPNSITKSVITAKYDFFIFFIAGIAEFYRFNYVKSEQHFRKALKFNHNHEAYSFLGDCLFFQNKIDDALIELDKALELCHNYAAALITKAEILIIKNPLDIDNSKQILEKVINDNPSEFNAYNNLGRIYIRKKEFQKAIDCYTKSISIKPNTIAYSNRGTLYKTVFRNYPNAVELSTKDFIKCLEINDNKYLYANYQLAKNYVLKDNEKALMHSNFYLDNAEFGDAEMYSVKAHSLCAMKRNFDEAENAAYMCYDIAKPKKNQDNTIYALGFLTLVHTLTVYTDHLVKTKKETLAFNKISVAFEMIKKLPLEEKATYSETIILYSIFIYNIGKKQYALNLLNEIEDIMPKNYIYDRLINLKTVYIKALSIPNFYINLTD